MAEPGGVVVAIDLDARTADEAAAFSDWVAPHWDVVVRYARRLVGEASGDDVAQEALTAAWRSRSTFDAARGEPRPWLLAIVTNEARRVGRQRIRDRARDGTAQDELADDAVVGTSHDVDAGVDVAVALRRLSERQRVAITLFYYLRLPVAECAAVMDCSAGTVKSTLSDARARLRSLLGEYR